MISQKPRNLFLINKSHTHTSTPINIHTHIYTHIHKYTHTHTYNGFLPYCIYTDMSET